MTGQGSESGGRRSGSPSRLPSPVSRLPVLHVVATLVIVSACAAAAMVATGFPARARIYPMTAAIAGVVLALVSLWLSARAAGRNNNPAQVDLPVRAAAPYFLAFAAYLGLVSLVGMIVASGVFVAASLRWNAKAGWIPALGSGLLLAGGLAGAGLWLGLQWPWALFDIAARMGL